MLLSFSTCKSNKDTEDGSNTAAGSLVSDIIIDVEPTGDETNTEPPTAGNTGVNEENQTTTTEGQPTVVSNGEKHYHTYKKAVTPPTCEADGFTTYACDCGAKYTDNTVFSTGHEYGEWKEIKVATETSVGKEERTCKNCKKKETREMPKLIKGHTHNYSASITKAATCTSEGVKTFACSCGASYTETIGKTAHNYTATVVNPTCTSPGYTKHTCSCGKTYYDNNVKATSHKYVDNVVTPTCTSAGYTTHTCSVCNYSYTDGNKNSLGHNYENKVVSPTCLETGYTTHTCKRCGYYYTDNKTQATGHKNIKTERQAATCELEGYEKEVCGVCGATVKNVTIPANNNHTYVTKSCSDVYKEVMANNTSFYYPYIANYQYLSDWNTEICSQCHRIKEGENKIRSKYTDEEQSKRMLGYVNELRETVDKNNPGFYNVIYDKVDLVYDAKLTELANIRAKEISVQFGHNQPNSTKTNAAENISSGPRTVEDAFNGWKTSTKGHYETMIMQEGVKFGFGRYINKEGITFNVMLIWKDGFNADNYWY